MLRIPMTPLRRLQSKREIFEAIRRRRQVDGTLATGWDAVLQELVDETAAETIHMFQCFSPLYVDPRTYFRR